MVYLIEANNPIPVDKALLDKYKKPVEDALSTFSYQNKPKALHELIAATDEHERFVMSDVERLTYLGIRDGMQVFRTVFDLVDEKVGLTKTLTKPGQEAVADKMRVFANSFAAYAASSLIIHRMEDAIAKAATDKEIPQAETNLEGRVFNLSRPAKGAMLELVLPVYESLVGHLEGTPEDKFTYEGELPQVVKNIFSHVRKQALNAKEQYPDLLGHVNSYSWRILDDEVVLNGFEDKTPTKVRAGVVQAAAFAPISANEIVGNQSAKRKITRGIERLCLYDAQKQLNPLLELGGLSWTNLFDGPPGTGKSSLFRLAMTILKARAEGIGVPYQIFTVDQSIKDEFYGKTGKILLTRLQVANDPSVLSIGIMDDIDLLSSNRNEAQGADNDINNILMQYLDGAFTVRRGNVINFAASNKPTGLDEAMRNRFNDRILIDGPKTDEDFADFIMLKLGKMIKKGLLQILPGYTPFATQDQIGEDGKWSGGKVAEYMADLFTHVRYRNATVMDFGKYMAKLKRKNNFITGRSANAIAEAIKERSADFDIPQEWFATRAAFAEQPWETKLGMLSELYVKITPEVMFQEAKRYFDSEQRYRANDTAEAVQRGYNNMLWEHQAQIKFLEDQLARGEGGPTELSQLDMLRNVVQVQTAKGQQLLENVMEKIDQTLAKDDILVATQNLVRQNIAQRKAELVQTDEE